MSASSKADVHFDINHFLVVNLPQVDYFWIQSTSVDLQFDTWSYLYLIKIQIATSCTSPHNKTFVFISREIILLQRQILTHLIRGWDWIGDREHQGAIGVGIIRAMNVLFKPTVRESTFKLRVDGEGSSW